MAEVPGRGRPRSAETDRSILDAARELLREDGPQRVNVEAVASRSGVARTTIYRRYARRGELLSAVLDGLIEPGLPAPDLAVRAKLLWVLRRVETLLDDGIGRGGTAALLTGEDPEFASLLRALLAQRLDELSRAMTADADAGRLSPGTDPDTLVGLLVGAHLAELVRHGSPRAGWAERTVDLIAPALDGGTTDAS